MRVRADEHISQYIVKLVNQRVLSQGWELTHVVQEGYRGASDEYWATQFASNGGHAILTADSDFLKKPNQVNAICRTGLKVIHLHPKYGTASCHEQMALILLWWKRIEEKLTMCNGKECWQVPWDINTKKELTRKNINFGAAQKKLKKQQKKRQRKENKT